MAVDNKKDDEARGFAGLSSLMSDVDTTPPAPPPPRVEKQGASSAPSPTQQEQAPASRRPDPRVRRIPTMGGAQSTSGIPPFMWVLGIAFVIFGLWYYGSSNERSSYPAPAYPAADSYVSSDADAGLGYVPAEEQVYEPPQLQEDRPSAGRDLVLSTSQIRYCLAEEIRMDAAKAAFNRYSDTDVSQFNNMVDDYNSRCGSFRYRSGALESARRDVEPYRAELEAEGRGRF